MSWGKDGSAFGPGVINSHDIVLTHRIKGWLVTREGENQEKNSWFVNSDWPNVGMLLEMHKELSGIFSIKEIAVETIKGEGL